MSALLGVAVEPVTQPEDAIGGADIVMCATNSIDNIFFARWIEPGMHISSIKLPELERAAIERADRVVIHTHDVKPLHVTTTGPRRSRARGQQGLGAGGRHRLQEHADAAGFDRRQGRRAGARASEVTCFINNLGLGYQFAAAGAVVYRKAKEHGLGHDLPTDWFTQDVHP